QQALQLVISNIGKLAKILLRELRTVFHQGVKDFLKRNRFCVHLRDIYCGRIDEVHDVDIEHKKKQNSHAHTMNKIFDLRRHAPAEEQFRQNEDDPPSIQRREWEEVEH